MELCLPYLKAQLAVVEPQVVVALGMTAARGLLGSARCGATLGALRGRWFDFEGRAVRVTYHPSYLLRNNALGVKRRSWEDLMAVMERLGLFISEEQARYFSGGVR